MKNLVVLTGAGISAESGIQTFRDMGGLWYQYDVLEVASPQGWAKNPQLVQQFYNERRKQLLECEPNDAHVVLKELEAYYNVSIITQNIDDLHERAGSSNVLHLHGELKKARSTVDDSLIYELDKWELSLDDKCEKGSTLRPHIVWFGEEVPAIPEAIKIVQQADILLVVGTSLNVYPAAGLVNYAPENIPIFVVDPKRPNIAADSNITFIEDVASTGLRQFKKHILQGDN